MMNMTEKQTNNKSKGTKRKNILSIARWVAVLMGVIGLLGETWFALFANDKYETITSTFGLNLTGWTGIGIKIAVIIVAVPVYVFLGFMGGAIVAFLYNLVVKRSNEWTEIKTWFFSSPLKKRLGQILLMCLWLGYSLFFILWLAG